MTNKKTLTDLYNELLAIEDVKKNPELVEFIEKRKELIAKKNTKSDGSKKMTATQKANEELKDLKVAILDYVEPDKRYTVTDLIKSVPELAELTNQKVSPLCNALVKEGKMCKETEKGRTYFYVEC